MSEGLDLSWLSESSASAPPPVSLEGPPSPSPATPGDSSPLFGGEVDPSIFAGLLGPDLLLDSYAPLPVSAQGAGDFLLTEQGPYAEGMNPVPASPLASTFAPGQGAQGGGASVMAGALDMLKKNPMLTVSLVNAIGSLLKKKPSDKIKSATNPYSNFTAAQKAMSDRYLNKNSFDWRLNPRTPVKMATGGSVKAPVKPSAYQKKFNNSVNTWLNQQAGVDRGKLTKAQREATQKHLWDMSNNVFEDIYGVSLDDFGTGKWKGDSMGANAETLANMQKYVKNPLELLNQFGGIGGGPYSNAMVFDPTHNQWVQGSYQTGSYNQKLNQHVKDPRSFAWSDYDLQKNREYGQRLNETLFKAFYSPSAQYGTMSNDPYAVDRYSKGLNPLYSTLQENITNLYGSQENALKYDPHLADVWNDPRGFASTYGLATDPDTLAKKYSTDLYGNSDKGLKDIYQESVQGYLKDYYNTDPFKKYVTETLSQYQGLTDLTADDLFADLASGGSKAQELFSRSPQELREQGERAQRDKALGLGYWTQDQSYYDNVPENLPASNMGRVGTHQWFKDVAPDPGLKVKEVPVNAPPPQPTYGGTVSWAGGNYGGGGGGIGDYPRNAEGPLSPTYVQSAGGGIKSYANGGRVKMSSGGNPNDIPIPEGFEVVWQGSGPNAVPLLIQSAPDGGGDDGGGCYITSAVMKARGDNDDEAPELQLMRKMRDDSLAEDPESMGPLVDEYYETAPKVVKALENREDADELLEALYEDFILPAAVMMENGNVEEAKRLYFEMIAAVAPLAEEVSNKQNAEQIEGMAQMARYFGLEDEDDDEIFSGGRVMTDRPGGGQTDQVEALLAADEYVIDADTVAALGDGSSEEGARRLDQMRRNVRRHKRSADVDSIPPKAQTPEQYMKKGKR